MLIDSHCHLDRLKLDQCGGSVTAAISAARDNGVSHMLCVCISKANREAVVQIAEDHEGVFASVGVHPSDAHEDNLAAQELRSWAQHRKVVAVGETGLDYYYTSDTKEAQQTSFATHLEVGGELGLPVIVHTRDAREDTLTLIRNHGNPDSAGVLHCFTESWEMAEAALDLGYYISFSGIVTFKNAQELKEVARRVPADRLLVETDSPYLAPIPYRGKSNQPKYVKAVAEYVAELRGETLAELAQYTSENFFRLFNRAK